MSAAQPAPRRYTVDEYFALEEQSDIRHEYYHGEIFPLDDPAAKAGGTKAHNHLVQNCAFALKLGLRGRSCEVFAENVRLAVDEGQHYNYPDVVVSCDPTDDDPRIIHRPVLIVEVLSKSTEARDRGWKFEQYQQLPSLQQYVLISQNRISVDSFTRTPAGSWELRPLRQLTDTLRVPSLGLEISVADLYENMDLPPLRLADQ
ncbi:Uma2 family endonuclease [Hymenobacter sp. ASUV-10]|uniref:Uma2 family endonuclease n=1 Tax=Hymenobacter aranciens TaxID=3063996 RepID=A0ABT9BDX3_9BACT|nr:Uma2 family endonuclease [Hymenobacter sp. ASUV-10]MDO7876465.1 Uma2 family endonuclease [Hymenobacter sp. ASUV-10]